MEPKGGFHTELVRILDMREVVLWKQTLVQVKVQWDPYASKEAIWEREDVMKQVYPFMFQDLNETE